MNHNRHLLFLLMISTSSAFAEINMSNCFGFQTILSQKQTANTDKFEFGVGIAALPRFNYPFGIRSSASIAFPIATGICGLPTQNRNFFKAYVSLPISFELNLGDKANKYTNNAFGIFAGAGIGYTAFTSSYDFVSYNLYFGYRLKDFIKNINKTSEFRINLAQDIRNKATYKLEISVLSYFE